MTEPAKAQGGTLERQALAALRKMRQKLDEIEHARTDPIAIVGLGCRLPGGVNDPEAYWSLLQNGVDAISEVPADRWSVGEYFDPNPAATGKTYSRWGGFMDQVDHFDAEFFGISPREAVHMDPQQRILLEVAWEALEDAGIAPPTLRDSNSGVFVGSTMTDYLLQHLRHGKASDLDAYVLSGNTINGISGRLAYFLGTHGPSISIDTACSSSLVAVDRACRSLRDGECALAIAGGVNLLLVPELFICMSRWGMLSPDGRCKTFDAAANGFVRAEGCGIVILKRLDAALANGDRIQALIRGSAVNQDGPSSGFSVPNGLAQEAVIRQALSNANVDRGSVGYIEAHGTGTTLGDPIEIDALARVFQPDRNRETPVALGSVKTNLGHLEAASGIAGLLKVVLMLGRGQIPPHLHLQQLSPHIAWEKYPFRIPTEITPWKPIHGLRVAGVSSFGFSGSNAHVILQEAPETTNSAIENDRPLQLLTLSARDEPALNALTMNIVAHLKHQPHLHFPDVCFTTNTGRSHFGHRLSLLSSTSREAHENLAAFLAGESSSGILRSRLSSSREPKIAFLFTGQGAQYAGMGLRLYDTSPIFRKAIDQCDELLRPHLDQTVLSLLSPHKRSEALLDRTIYTQPAIFALEYALYILWRSWGIEPNFVLGHSLGEYVAACVAGVFSLETALKLVALRARLMQAEPAGGGMMAVSAAEALVRGAIKPFSRTVSIAAINGPRNIVISGAFPDLETIAHRLAADGIPTKKLRVSHAFHSPLMEPMQATFEKAVTEISLQPPATRLVSNLSGRVVTAEEITRPEYWRNHLREPVRFATGIQTLVDSGCDIFLEIGPGPVLLGMARQCTAKTNALWLPTLRPDRDDWTESLTSLQALYHEGVSVNWTGFDSGYPRRRVQLPTYPFQRERFWFESKSDSVRSRRTNYLPERPDGHPLLGVPLRSPALKATVFQSQLSAQHPAFLADHQICRHVVLPASAYLEMALTGADNLFGKGTHRVEDLRLQELLQLSFKTPTSIQVVFQAKSAGPVGFEIFSTADGQDANTLWTRNVSGQVVSATKPYTLQNTGTSLEAMRERCLNVVDIAALYQKLNDQGTHFGSAFRNLSRLWRGMAESLAEIKLTDSLFSEAGHYRFHPVLMDACFQAAAQALPLGQSTLEEDELLLPVHIERVQISPDVPNSFWSHSRLRPTSGPGATAFTLDLQVYDLEGLALGEITGLQLKRIKRKALEGALQTAEKDWLFEIKWLEAPAADAFTPTAANVFSQPGNWLILADEQGIGEALRERFTAAGQDCVLVRPSSSFVRQNKHQFSIDPSSRMDFKRLLEEIGRKPASLLRGVLHLWSLDFPDFDTMTGEDLARSQVLGCGGALHLVQALLSLKTDAPPSIWLVTQGALATPDSLKQLHPAMMPLCGLGQVIAMEHPELRCRRLDLDQQPTDSSAEILFGEITGGEYAEDTVAFRNQSRLVPRLVPLHPETTLTASAPPSSETVQLEVSQAGILESLRWTSTTNASPAPGELEIRVQATGLNFRDVLCSLGMYPGKIEALGAECAGTITRTGEGVADFAPGEKVMAVARGGFSTYVTVRADHVASLADGVSLIEAASIPVAFLTTFYGLVHLARMKSQRSGADPCGSRWRGISRYSTGAARRCRNFCDSGKPGKEKPFAKAGPDSRFRFTFSGFREMRS